MRRGRLRSAPPLAMSEDQNRPAPEAQEEGIDLESDTPMAPACDLSGEGSCEACQ